MLANFVVNQRSYSCINVTRERTLQNFEKLNRFKPDYIAGSPLTLSLFSKFIADNNLHMLDALKSTIGEIDRNLVLTFQQVSEDGLEYTEAGKHKFVMNRYRV